MQRQGRVLVGLAEHREAQRLHVLGRGLAAGDGRAEADDERDERAEGDVEELEQLRLVPGGVDLLDLVAELGQQIGRVAHRGGVPGVHRSLDRGLEGEADAQATWFPLCRRGEGLGRGRRPCGIPQLVAGEHVEHGRRLEDGVG